jgi:hypothetical protein
MDDARIVAGIREAVEVGNFEYDQEHCDRHMGIEGFDLEDAVRVVVSGDVIDPTPERDRWLFCGKVSSLAQDARFLGQWVHVSAEYGEVISLPTMYRPLVTEWRTERVRR